MGVLIGDNPDDLFLRKQGPYVCTETARRGDSVVRNWQGKPVTFSEAEKNTQCKGKDWNVEKTDFEEVISELVSACEGALLLQGLALAIRDPLALDAEKKAYRTRYREIETQLRKAIAKANLLKQ